LRKEHDAVIDSVHYLGSHVLGPDVECNNHKYWTNQEPGNSTSRNMQQVTIRMDDMYELFDKAALNILSFPATTSHYIALLSSEHNILDNEKKPQIFGSLRLSPAGL